jgi:hypothetical protein
MSLNSVTLLRDLTSPLDTKPMPIAMSDKIRTYAELREFIRVSLRIQNPEWVRPNGDSPICDSYEARFVKLIGLTDAWENGGELVTAKAPFLSR